MDVVSPASFDVAAVSTPPQEAQPLDPVSLTSFSPRRERRRKR